MLLLLPLLPPLLPMERRRRLLAAHDADFPPAPGRASERGRNRAAPATTTETMLSTPLPLQLQLLSSSTTSTLATSHSLLRRRPRPLCHGSPSADAGIEHGRDRCHVQRDKDKRERLLLSQTPRFEIELLLFVPGRCLRRPEKKNVWLAKKKISSIPLSFSLSPLLLRTKIKKGLRWSKNCVTYCVISLSHFAVISRFQNFRSSALALCVL